ncbi:NAD(P)-binding protein [Stipitochalara longipes BDJ]|nr:NAD(P)-binding protein [Stipitochalara longipes BDJ]
MTQSTSKQSVLITGCSKDGIGDALAQKFLSRDFKVFATARNLAKVQHLKDLGCDILTLDVTDEKSVGEAVGYVTKKTGGELHYLINNAGMVYKTTILDADMAAFKQVYATKVFGTVSMTRSFGPLLIKAKGTICNIGSMSTYFLSPIVGVYASANSALEFISHQMRMELEPFGVSVVHVIGGAVQSNLNTNRLLPSWSPDSLYYPVRHAIDKASNPEWEMMPASQFAQTLVSKLTLKKKPAMVYLGSKLWFAYLLSFVAWCAGWFVGVRFWDLISAGPMGMKELKKIVEREEREKQKHKKKDA